MKHVVDTFSMQIIGILIFYAFFFDVIVEK